MKLRTTPLARPEDPAEAATMLLLEFNAILLVLATWIAYPLSVYYYRHYTQQDRRKWVHILAEMGLIVLVGPWISIITVMFFTTIVLRIFGHVMLRGSNLTSPLGKSLKTGQKIRAGIVRFFIATLAGALAVFHGVVVAGRFSGGDAAYIVAFCAGTGIVACVSAKHGVPFYNGYDLHQGNPGTRALRREAIGMVVAVACVSALVLVASPANRPSIQDGLVIKTMTFNILYAGEDGSLMEWMDRREPLSGYIESLDLDVFGLQEVFRIQGDYLNATLSNRNYTWVGIGRETPSGNFTGEHDAIFFDMDKFTLIDNGTLWFSDTPTVSSRTWLTEAIKRTYQWVHLQDKDSGTEFFFYNTHYGFYPEFHVKASAMLNGDIARRTGTLPVIVTGDFNMPPIFPFYSFLEGFGSKPVYNAARLAGGFVPPMTIDFIFVTPDVHVASIETCTGANAGPRWLSDHDPVVMTCELPAV